MRSRLGEEWEQLLRAEFSDPAYKSADIHRAIFELDVKIVLSGNFDHIYDNYTISASEQTIVVKDHTSKDTGNVVFGSDRYIIKLHGSIDSPDDMVFTTSDYAIARNKYRDFYNFLGSLITTNVCLLVGCGLDDPDMRIIFEDFRFRNRLVPHYILLPKPLHKDEIDLVRETRGLNAILYSARDDHAELTTGLFDLGKKVDSRRDQIAEDQSW